MPDDRLGQLAPKEQKILSPAGFTLFIEELASAVVETVCERKNPDFRAILEELFSVSALKALMSLRFGDDFVLDGKLIPDCEYPLLDFRSFTIEERMGMTAPAEGAVDRRQPTKRPHLDIAADSVYELLPNYIEIAIKAKIEGALSALEAAVSVDDVAQSIAEAVDLSSAVKVLNRDCSVCWPDGVFAKFEKEMFLISSFESLVLASNSVFLLRVDQKAGQKFLNRISSEIYARVKSVLDCHAERERSLDDFIDTEITAYSKDKSMAVQLYIASLRERISFVIKERLKDEFINQVELVAGFDEAQWPQAVENLIARFGATTVGKYVNNFIMWIPDFRETRYHNVFRSWHFEFICEDGLLDQPLINSEDGSKLIGKVDSGKLWRKFFEEIEEEFLKLNVSDEQWAGFESQTQVNCALLPMFIAMAKKGYNVRFFTV